MGTNDLNFAVIKFLCFTRLIVIPSIAIAMYFDILFVVAEMDVQRFVCFVVFFVFVHSCYDTAFNNHPLCI